MDQGHRVLLISDDDDVAETLATLLRRDGHRVDHSRSEAGADALAGPPPDVLILDHDLPPARYREVLDLIGSRTGDASIPLLLLGDSRAGQSLAPPPGWHEDAWMIVPRPPHPGELSRCVTALLRLAFYRGYRTLVHDLSQPATAIHALSRRILKACPEGDPGRDAAEHLAREAERLMSLMETFQRNRPGRSKV